jgi:hypothetical protein
MKRPQIDAAERKAQMKVQMGHIRQTLQQIKNKILVMR